MYQQVFHCRSRIDQGQMLVRITRDYKRRSNPLKNPALYLSRDTVQGRQ
jgi:hypothetical protein